MEHKDAMERPFNTEARRHRNTEAQKHTETQREELNATLKKFNRIARMVRINRMVLSLRSLWAMC
jgi:hypothetical protein